MRIARKTVVDTDEAIVRAVNGISDLVSNGLIATSDVEIIKYAHGSAATTGMVGTSGP